MLPGKLLMATIVSCKYCCDEHGQNVVLECTFGACVSKPWRTEQIVDVRLVVMMNVFFSAVSF
jgi:hypothetical protein